MRTFFAIAYNEVLLNSKRVAPYVVAILCAGNALLWWGWGPATGKAWATNADFFIAGVLPPYSFLFLPLFTVVIMADPAIRDFRARIDPLIFSKPVSRAEYLLGKFFGNFFILACCQSAFVLMLFVLQWVPKQGMIVQEAKFLAYPKHFLVFVAISHLLLAAFYFTVGTLTRSATLVYGLGVGFYPLYISYSILVLKRLPTQWGVLLDPLVMGWKNLHRSTPELINQTVVVYDSILIGNRAGMILLTAICLTILYLRFTTTERSEKAEKFNVLSLSTAAQRVDYQESSPAVMKSVPPASAGGSKRTLFKTSILDPSAYADGNDLVPHQTFLAEFERPDYTAPVAVPEVVRVNKGFRANVNKLIAAIAIEFRLLRAERSLVVVMPLAIFLCLLEVAFYNIPPDVSQSAAYASNTATSLLIFLIGMAVFYTGEAMHRDREDRIEPFLWTTPVPNSVLILSKFLSNVSLLFVLIVSVGVATVAIQVVRHPTPIDLVAYLKVYGLILLPSALILTAIAVFANVVLRNKYAFYVVSIGTAAGLFYLYSNGHNHWLYNPVLYRLWSYADLTQGVPLRAIIWQRAGWLAAAITVLGLAHLFFERKQASRRFR